MTNDLRLIFEKKRAPLKAEEVVEAGYSYKEILAMETAGEIKRLKSGYYTCPDISLSEEELVCGLFKDGVFTMESALFYHGYLIERPFHWSIAISKNTSKSRFKLDYPIIHPYYTEPFVLSDGVEEKDIDCGKIHLYNKDRLICEVLKYEEKMDKEDFRQAVFTYINDKSKDTARFLEYAKKRRVIKKARAVIGIWL